MVDVNKGFFGSSYLCEWCQEEFTYLTEAKKHEDGCELASKTFDEKAWINENIEIAKKREELLDYKTAIKIYETIGELEEAARVKKIRENQNIEMAKKREELLDYKTAIKIYEKIGKLEEAARVRKLKAEQGAVKVDQTVVHGDYVDDRDTIVKDSVINRSNVGAGSSKMQELEKLAEMKEKGLIDDDEFKQMKKEILGK